jgi:uncharacterized membrane protein YtjA (UPF0391 family)
MTPRVQLFASNLAAGKAIQQVQLSGGARAEWNPTRHRKLDGGFCSARRRRASWRKETVTLLKWALLFFVISVVAGILGFTDISAASADVARFLFYVFVVIFLVLLVLGFTIFRV